MAEIEHFVDPNDKSHPKFASVKDLEMVLYSACNQMDGQPAKRITIGEAVAKVPAPSCDARTGASLPSSLSPA